MSNLICTLEDQTKFAGEIELTDAELSAVFGACSSDNDSSCNSNSNSSCNKKKCHKSHEEFSKKMSVHFDFDLDINKEKDISDWCDSSCDNSCDNSCDSCNC